jgi:ABC-2 type transport system permease protein
MLSAALFIARHDLAFILRQKETLLWVFVMPIVFFYFIGTVTGGFGGGRSADRPDPIAMQAPADGGVIVDELVRRLEEQNFDVIRAKTTEEFDAYSRRLTIPAMSTHPTVTAAVIAGSQLEATFERRGDALAANLDEFRVSRAVYAVVADLAVMKSQGQEVTAARFSDIAAAPRRLTLSVRSAGRRLEAPAGFAQAVPGTMVMFTMIILLTSGAVMLVVEREHGLLRRLASAPISRGAIVLGKWSARMVLGLVQLGFAMAIGTVLFRIDWGGNVPMVALVLVAWAALNASLALLLGNITRTQAQTTGVGVLASMMLAALGGCWWPIEITPPWMQAVATVLPTGWTMDAMHKLVNFGYGPETATPHVVALFASALAAGWAGARIFRYQ